MTGMGVGPSSTFGIIMAIFIGVLIITPFIVMSLKHNGDNMTKSKFLYLYFIIAIILLMIPTVGSLGVAISERDIVNILLSVTLPGVIIITLHWLAFAKIKESADIIEGKKYYKKLYALIGCIVSMLTLYGFGCAVISAIFEHINHCTDIKKHSWRCFKLIDTPTIFTAIGLVSFIIHWRLLKK